MKSTALEHRDIPPKSGGADPVSPKPRSSEGGWFPLLAPPAAWSVQGLLGWFFGERTCGDLTPATVRWIVLGLSVLALLVALAGVSRGWRLWRSRSAADNPMHTDAPDRLEFMALAGVLVSSVFTIAIVWAGLSSAFLNDCGRMR